MTGIPTVEDDRIVVQVDVWDDQFPARDNIRSGSGKGFRYQWLGETLSYLYMGDGTLVNKALDPMHVDGLQWSPSR